jgi:hypothetical protein
MDVISVYDDGAMLGKEVVGISPADLLAKF